MLSVTQRFVPASPARGLWPAELRAAALDSDRDAIELCAGLTEHQLSWSPAPHSWSIAQNIAHLRATTNVFLPAVDAALETSRTLNLQRPGPYSLSLYGRVIIWQMESRLIRLKSPEAVHPCLLDSPAAELSGFLLAQSALRQRLDAAAGVDLTAVRFPSPLLKCFRVNLLEFFAAFNAHNRRHLRQAQKLRRSLPSA